MLFEDEKLPLVGEIMGVLKSLHKEKKDSPFIIIDGEPDEIKRRLGNSVAIKEKWSSRLYSTYIKAVILFLEEKSYDFIEDGLPIARGRLFSLAYKEGTCPVDDPACGRLCLVHQIFYIALHPLVDKAQSFKPVKLLDLTTYLYEEIKDKQEIHA